MLVLLLFVPVVFVSAGSNATDCEAMGEWSEWYGWTPCPANPKSDGENLKFRARTCRGIPRDCVASTGFICIGPKVEIFPCAPPPTNPPVVGTTITVGCLDEGTWTEWSPWSNCCSDNDTLVRVRRCLAKPEGCATVTDPVCIGNEMDEKACTPSIPQNEVCYDEGVWGQWSEWTLCSTSALLQTRERNCDKVPIGCVGNGTITCLDGLDKEEQNCTALPPLKEETTVAGPPICDTTGTWTEWSSWMECPQPLSADAALNVQRRARKCAQTPEGCVEDAPASCLGANSEERPCKLPICDSNGKWSEWSEWSECPSPASDNPLLNIQLRSRLCESITENCLLDPQMTANCGNEAPSEKRDCAFAASPASTAIPGTTDDSAKSATSCYEEGVWSQWSEWSSCTWPANPDKSKNTQTRERTCDKVPFDCVPTQPFVCSDGTKDEQRECAPPATVIPTEPPLKDYTTLNEVAETLVPTTTNKTLPDTSVEEASVTESEESESSVISINEPVEAPEVETTTEPSEGEAPSTVAPTVPPPPPTTTTIPTPCWSWQKWLPWGQCDKTCGMCGRRQRLRVCEDTASCSCPKKLDVEKQVCNEDPCMHADGHVDACCAGYRIGASGPKFVCVKA